MLGFPRQVRSNFLDEIFDWPGAPRRTFDLDVREEGDNLVVREYRTWQH